MRQDFSEFWIGLVCVFALIGFIAVTIGFFELCGVVSH